MFNTTDIKKIKNLFDKIELNEEFEVMFNNYKLDNKLSIVKFMDILKYLKYKSEIDKLILKQTVILDIIQSISDNHNFYRVSINGIQNINNFLNLVHQRSNNIIFSLLFSQSEFINNENFLYIKKEKNTSNIIDFNEYDIRIRKSTEIKLNEKDLENINLKLNKLNIHEDIKFRYKNRLSLDLIDNENEKLSIDLTIVQFNSNVNELSNSPKGYEIEIDYMIKKNKINIKTFDKILKEIEIIKKIIESSDILLLKEEINEITLAYHKLVNNTDGIYTMQPISAEVQHVIDKFPNYYSVTDKADGEKYQLFIYNSIVYLISNTFNIKKTKYKSELNNTIIEGELISIHDQINKYIFMGFDCLYYENKNISDEPELKKRLEYLNKTCVNLNKNIYINKIYNEIFSLKSQENFYKKEIENFYNHLNEEVLKLKHNDIYFHPKYFLFPTGGSDCEVYLFSNLIWEYYSKSKINYSLDGIIFTGLDQKYTKNKQEQKYPIYKYKPPITNSIDVYINFQKNIETNTYLEIYDNSIGTKTNQSYRVVNFLVGDLIGNKEVPVLFMKEEQNHEAYFPLINDEIRDQDGNYVQDNTVIEVVYNNDPLIPHPYRWSILRTRWDKTDSVYKYQKKYGNFKDVAIRTWKSIKEAVTTEEIKNLSNESTFTSQKNLLKQRLNSIVITTERQQDVYYQKITNLCKPLRNFHNWIKSAIITTYCSPKNISHSKEPSKLSILDIGCGVGGDLMKFYHARFGEYVGIDVDYHGLYSSTNGAVSRYNEMKSKFPNFGKVTWIQADASSLLTSEYQEKKLLNMTKENKQLIEKVFNKKKFDCITAMFSLHYLFESEETTNNLVTNINNHLKVGGSLLFTLFDAKLVMKLFGEKNIYTSYYTDENGERQKLFEIIKKFEDKLESNIKEGYAIDVYMGWISEENKYLQEFLVTPELLNKVMKKANCKLIETDSFQNMYNLNYEYFTNVINHEENPKNFEFYKKVAMFYGDLKGADKESKIYSFLNRYYIYQKIK
jgi:SAM-dependent methyltransferase